MFGDYVEDDIDVQYQWNKRRCFDNDAHKKEIVVLMNTGDDDGDDSRKDTLEEWQNALF